MTGLRPAVIVALVMTMVLGMTAPAAAHTQLDHAAPRPGETVQRLHEIRLEFRGPVLADGHHAIWLYGPGGTRWDQGPPRVVSDRVIAVGVAAPLREAGEYTVRWCATMPDGHPQPGAYKFSYAGPVSPAAAAPEAAQTPCGVADNGDGARTAWLLALAAAGSLAVATTVILAAIRHRRSRAGTDRRR